MVSGPELCERIEGLVRGWLGDSLQVRAGCVDPQDLPGLWPQEAVHVQGAVLKRRVEFATARRLARENLQALGLPPMALVPRADRSPVWPASVVGSISHNASHCAVICAAKAQWRSVGVDLETRREFSSGMAKMVLTPEELEGLAPIGSVQGQAQCLMYFCLKEAFYKFQSPLTGEFLDFQDVTLRQCDASTWSIQAAAQGDHRARRAFERLGHDPWQLRGAWLGSFCVLAVAAQRAVGGSRA